MSNIIVFYGNDNGNVKMEIKQFLGAKKITETFDLIEDSLSNVIISAATFSMFEDEKIILCENADFMTGKKTDYSIAELEKYIENPNSKTTLILTVNSEKLDERKKIVKKLKKDFKIIDCVFKEVDEKEYIKQHFQKRGYNISSKTIDLILDRIGENKYRLEKELEKLELLKIDSKEITEEDVKELIIKDFSNSIFDLIDLLLKKQNEKAYKLYQELVRLGEEPIKILIMLANQYRLIYQIQLLSANRYSEKEIATLLKKHPYAVKLAKQKSYLYNKKDIKEIIKKIALIDYKIKSGKTNKKEVIDIFILTI